MLRLGHKTVMLGIVLLTGLSMTACVRYYKTKDIRRTFHKSGNEIDSLARKAEQDFADRERQYRQIEKRHGERHPGVVKLSTLLEKLRCSLADIKSKNNQLDALRARFDRLAKGKKKIRSDRPEWEQCESIRNQYEQLGDQVRAASERYQKAARLFATSAAALR